jgi:hypothetical protein
MGNLGFLHGKTNITNEKKDHIKCGQCKRPLTEFITLKGKKVCPFCKTPLTKEQSDKLSGQKKPTPPKP